MTDLQRALVALGALVACLTALVILTVTGSDTAPVIGVIAPVISGLWAVGEVRAARTSINGQLNGALDLRIRQAVASALHEVPHEVPRE